MELGFNNEARNIISDFNKHIFRYPDIDPAVQISVNSALSYFKPRIMRQ